MVLTVRADIVAGVQAPTVTAQIAPLLQPIMAAPPPGYRIETGGAVEESNKANVALFKIFPLMFVAMLSLLMLQLRSFSKLFLMFLTAPLGVIGAVAALLVFNSPFGLVALLGVIALAGMIMRNPVILVDQIDRDLAAGCPPWQRLSKAPRAAGGADRTCCNSCDDPTGAIGVLGADGAVDHGRADRGHGADAILPSRPLRRMVPHQAQQSGTKDNPRNRTRRGSVTGIGTTGCRMTFTERPAP